ncbi:hypothetical protein ACRW3U_27785, partial [Escherichia coli]
TLKMPAFEWVHVQLHQQKGMISLSPPTICNSAFSLASSPVMINGNASSGEEDSRKKNPPAKILGMNSFRYSGCWRVNFLMK